ncbi:MAG TPA: amino acid adenylation domain-containing protein, partial [Pseudonocardiaceae bacterium]|nr:amino acid adenylation domain-containing protein [Pseudonocardiaceae bacterium]
MTDTMPATPASPLVDAYPLTALQTGMLFHSELRPGSATYHDLFTLTLHGTWSADALAAALREVTERHPVLRTSFNLTDFTEPLQLVHASVRPPLSEADWTGLAEDEARTRLLAWREREKLVPIDWTEPPLLRTFAHRLPAGRFALTLSFHHAILDGWSVATLTTELLGRYTAQLAGLPIAAQPLPITYREFVAAEKAAVAAPDGAEFWRDALADAPAATLPRLPGHPTGTGDDIDTLELAVAASVADGLVALHRQAGVPLRTVLLAAHLRVLGLVTGQVDVTTGIVAHNRPEHEAGGQVLGLFLNAVPVRVRIDRPSWRELVRAVFDTELAVLPHRAYPLFEIQNAVDRSPLYEALFDYRDFHVYQDLPDGGPIEVVGQDFFEQTNVPFAAAFSRDRATGTLRLTLTYQRQQFPRGWIERVAEHYRHALAAIAADPAADPRPSDGFLAGPDADSLASWNDTGTEPGPDDTLADLVAASVARRPAGTALVWRGEPIGYAEFGDRVARHAGALIGSGVRPGDVVGVLLPRGADLVHTVHAVLAAGAAYLPLDPDLPDQRLALMCRDAGTRVVVTDETGRVSWPDAPVVVPATATAEPAQVVSVPADSPAYVIYTSGSTGTPKGVAVSHRSIVHRLRWMQAAFPLADGDRVVHKTPFGFDVSVWELCWPLLAGGTMVIAEPDGHRDTAYLSRLFAEQGVSVAHFVPAMLDALLDDPDAVARSTGLRRVICSGEALRPELADRCAELLPHTELHNLYGPTEAAVDVTRHRCVPGERPLPIGRPVPGTRLHVVDPLGEPVPVGVPGELCIAGVQVALGYLGRPGATAERFTPDPDGPPGTRRYRTGDRARWLPTGEIEYLGRLDDQVKVRGMRVEPGEIEAALAALPEVRAAAVTAHTDQAGTRLAGYVVPADPDQSVDPARLRDQLADTLPTAMVPATIQVLPELPVGRNGKLDRRALPDPVAARSAGYWPPRDQTEARLATIWEQLL